MSDAPRKTKARAQAIPPAPPFPETARLAILESVFASITDSLLVMDNRLRVVDANHSLLTRLGRLKPDVIGAAWTDLFPHLADMGRVQDLEAVLKQGRAHRGRMPLLNAASGEALLFDVTTYPLFDAHTGEVTHLVEYAHEVSEEVKLQLQIVDAHSDLLAVTEELEAKTAEIDAANQLLEEKCGTLEEMNIRLEHLAVMDAMTDLPNHRAFQERLAQHVQQTLRHKHSFSLVIFDVDNFKQYNDRFGHPHGDILLAQLARLLRENIRVTDLPARYGGEEFALILPETDKYGAALVAERLRAAVAEYSFPHRQVTISIGIAEFPGDATQGSDLVTCADKAMYHAKSSGKNAVSLWGSQTGRPVLAGQAGAGADGLSEMASLPGGACRSVPALPLHLVGGSASGRSLLLVDADDLSCGTVREALMAEGYAVAVAQSAREALGMLSEGPSSYDLVVSDLALPDRTGLELMEAARVLHPQAPFVFLASHGAVDGADRAQQSPQTHLLVKPFTLHNLMLLVEHALASSRTGQQARAA